MKAKLVKLYFDFRQYKLPAFFAKNRTLASYYYFFFNTSFKREHFSVLKGKIKHLEDIQNESSNIHLLIRNTHRIEKGLLMRPRRKVFALDYIEETVTAFIKIASDENHRITAQFNWFKNVLEAYFEVVELDANLGALKKVFYAKVNNTKNDKANKLMKIPYNRNEALKPNISFNDFYKLNKYRRSVRWFLDKKVPRELVEKAITAGIQAPSACNRQPFEYFIIDNPEKLKYAIDLPMGTKGYQESVPMLIVVVGNLDAYFSERDRHIIYIDASLANMSIMLGLETLGLSSCAINWPDVEEREKKMEDFLKLEKHQRPLMCMAVGYPDPEGMVAFSEKKDVNNLITYI